MVDSLPCPACRGEAGRRETCEACGGEGHPLVTSCPRRLIGEDVAELLLLADVAKDGTWPNGRGTLHEAKGFVEAARFLWNAEAAVGAGRKRAKADRR